MTTPIKNLDDNGLLYFWQKIKNLFVRKEDGKGLSSNDYTTTEKNKLAGIDDGADQNVIEQVKVNGTALTPDSNKAVDVTVPTKTSDLTNDSDFVADANYVHTDNNYSNTDKSKLDGIANGADVSAIKSVKVNGSALTPDADKAVDIAVPTNNNQLTNGAGYQTSAQVQAAINSAIEGITGINFEVVTTLPATGEAGTIYLVSNGGSGQNVYDEYIWLSSSSKFEKIGTTDVDLSGYLQESDIVAITNAEIDTIVAS